MSKSCIAASDVAHLYRTLDALGIDVWIDGGWGVDALLGKQTRGHSDVDIVVQEKDLAMMRSFLESQGFREVPQTDTRPWNFVLADAEDRRVDVHVIWVDPEGNGIYGPPQHGEFYPASALTGCGVIDGLPVRCMSPQYQVVNHTGYKPREIDYLDVRALVEKFELELPEDHRANPRRL
jgi:lincosamide nucleotidyltransferase A/C/D/E